MRLRTSPSPSLERRSFLGIFAGASFLSVFAGSEFAWAGSYLDRAAILLENSQFELRYASRRLGDKELMRLSHHIADGRLRGANTMDVPKEVVLAHPHLLLSLEGAERAFFKGMEGDMKGFHRYFGKAKDEELAFRSIVTQLGWEVPNLRD